MRHERRACGCGQAGRRRSRAEVEALVAEYEASGVTCKAFCAGRGLSEATLEFSSVDRDLLAELIGILERA
jgi:hypothetical protein